MTEKNYRGQPSERPGLREGEVFEKAETEEQKPEVKEQFFEEVKKKEKEERIVPTVEVLKTAAVAPTTITKRNLTEGEEREIDSLVSLTIKNPDLEKGLEEANKLLNEKIRRIKREGKDFAYLIDEFHDRLVLKIKEREKKLEK